MSDFTDEFLNYCAALRLRSTDKLLLSKLDRLENNNIATLIKLEKILDSNDPAQVMRYVQFHCSSEPKWKDENNVKANHVLLADAVAMLAELQRMIERSTIAVLVATMFRHNLRGTADNASYKVFLKCWGDARYNNEHHVMQVHSSHLGLSPNFAHGNLTGNSVLAGMVALTENHADNWHAYTFNVCLIKIADSTPERMPGAGRLLLVTQNNRSCFAHGVSRMPPMVFNLCEDDLTANFRKFKVFEDESLATVLQCKERPHIPVKGDEGIVNLHQAIALGISGCVDLLAKAYQQNDERKIRELGRQPAYTHACLENTSIATVADARGKVHKVSVPSGLYEHGGAATLAGLPHLLALWKLDQKGRPQQDVLVDGLKVVGVADDGHCLFSAVALKAGRSVRALRVLAADYLLLNPALLPDPDQAGKYTEDLKRMDKNILWGGALEMMALAEELGTPIVVHQDGAAPTPYVGDVVAHPGLLYVPGPNDIHIYHCSTQGAGGPLNHFDGLA